MILSYLGPKREFGKTKRVTHVKHPLLLNACYHKFVHCYVTESLVRYTNDPVPHFLYLYITSSLIDFIFFRRQYLRHSRKRNRRSSFSALICCKQSVPTYSWLEHRFGITITVICVFTGTLRGVGNIDWTMLSTKWNGVDSPVRPICIRQPSGVTRSVDKNLILSSDNIQIYAFLAWSLEHNKTGNVHVTWRARVVFTRVLLT
jgi:hypothetical protein